MFSFDGPSGERDHHWNLVQWHLWIPAKEDHWHQNHVHNLSLHRRRKHYSISAIWWWWNCKHVTNTDVRRAIMKQQNYEVRAWKIELYWRSLDSIRGAYSGIATSKFSRHLQIEDIFAWYSSLLEAPYPSSLLTGLFMSVIEVELSTLSPSIFLFFDDSVGESQSRRW